MGLYGYNGKENGNYCYGHPPCLPAPLARSSESAACSSVLVVVDVVDVNVIMGAGMDSLCVDVVEMNGWRHAFASILFRCK